MVSAEEKVQFYQKKALKSVYIQGVATNGSCGNIGSCSVFWFLWGYRFLPKCFICMICIPTE